MIRFKIIRYVIEEIQFMSYIFCDLAMFNFVSLTLDYGVG